MNCCTAPAKFILFVFLFFGAAEVFAAEGDLDPTFDGDGIVTTDNGSANYEEIRDLAVQPDGKIIALGYSPIESASTNRAVIVRYNADGTIDATFGTSGKVFIETLVNPQSLIVQPDGKIVAVGSSAFFPNNNFYVARLNADGSFDTTFNGTGTIILDFGGADVAQSVKIQPDGKIVIGGQSGNGITNLYVIVRLTADGSLDAAFDGDGRAIAQIGGDTLSVKAVALQAGGKILVGGKSLIRYNPDGSLDSTFGSGGKISTPAGSDIEVQSDNKIVLALQNGGAARFTADGSPDLTFSGDGQNVIQAAGGVTAAANASAIQSGGKIIIGGFIGSSDARDFLLARFETASCTYNLSPGSLKVSSAGGAFSFTVTTQQGCSETVKSNDPFITINTKAIGENSEVIFLSITYTVAANTAAARNGTISVGNQNFTVIQSAVKSRERVRFF